MKQYIKPVTRALDIHMERMIAASGEGYSIYEGEGTDDSALTHKKSIGWSDVPWTHDDEYDAY